MTCSMFNGTVEDSLVKVFLNELKGHSLATESEVNNVPGDMTPYYQNICVLNQVRSLLYFWINLSVFPELEGMFYIFTNLINYFKSAHFWQRTLCLIFKRGKSKHSNFNKLHKLPPPRVSNCIFWNYFPKKGVSLFKVNLKGLFSSIFFDSFRFPHPIEPNNKEI